MNKLGFLNDLIEDKLLSLHTAYLAKVLSSDGSTAKIQPLCMVKQYGHSAQKQSILSNVPIVQSARFKMTSKTDYIDGSAITYVEPTPLAAGDIVICVCCDRNITEAKNGRMTTPPVGHHSMSDSVIVGIL